jgi:hypothetical protein
VLAPARGTHRLEQKPRFAAHPTQFIDEGDDACDGHLVAGGELAVHPSTGPSREPGRPVAAHMRTSPAAGEAVLNRLWTNLHGLWIMPVVGAAYAR